MLDAVEFIGQLACVYQDAEQQAARSKTQLQALLPTPQAKTLIQHARSVTLRTGQPLSLNELLRLMKLDGHQPTSGTGRMELKEALRASGQFFETANGEWSMSRPPAEPPSVPKSVPVGTRCPATRRPRITNNQRLRRRKSPPVAPSMRKLDDQAHQSI
jgi:hypothetical protein